MSQTTRARATILRTGENVVRGVPVVVERKRIRRINVRIRPDGGVSLSVPKWWATLKEGEDFLLSKWPWVLKAREEILSRPVLAAVPLDEGERLRLEALLGELTSVWAARLGEPAVTWKVRRVKSVWGSCHIRKRHIVYNAELARAPRELVEYVVVHELTHLKAADHGPRFYRLMDERLPGWQALRRRLNKRQFVPLDAPPPKPRAATRVYQSEFAFEV